jgi:D-apionolactonase
VEQVQPAIQTWLVFHEQEEATAEKWVQLAREHLASYDPQAKIGGGTNGYFTQINRNPLPLAALDLVSYSLNPEVHAFDNASLAETLEVQATTVDSARQIIGAAPLAVSPVTLRPRLKPNGSGPAPEAGPGELPPQVDVRQMSLFGAGWTVGSLKYLAESGVDSLTYYETSGWRGVMETEAGSPLPDKFPSLPGSVFPIYHILADAGEFAEGEVIPTQSSDILQLEGLALYKDGKTRVLLANLSAEPQRVVLPNLSGRVRVRYLDETNAVEAMRSPEKFRQQEGESQQISGTLELNLQPYAIARIDTISADGK